MKDKDPKHTSGTQLFKEAMKGVKLLKHNKTSQHKSKNKAIIQSKPTSQYQDTPTKSYLTDKVSQTVNATEVLSYSVSGIAPRTLKKLKTGKFPVEVSLDLHGHTIDEARTLLSEFVHSSQAEGLKVVHVIHGKGSRAESLTPKLKNLVNAWLPQLDEVLAYCSCLPRDGGTGAIYVLLRRLK